MQATSRLIHQKEVSANQKVSVWREERQQGGSFQVFYRKLWQCDAPVQAQAWLSWAEHEHMLLTFLAARGAQHAVVVTDLHKDQHNIELVTRDAGPELQRDVVRDDRRHQKERAHDERQRQVVLLAHLAADVPQHALALAAGQRAPRRDRAPG